MTVETFTDTAPDELNVSLPASGDSRTEGDNHLRNIKNVIKTTFANVSGPVTSSEAELNYVDISALGTWQAGKALTAAATTGAISCANLAMTNINIDSGDITGVSYAGGTVTGSLTWNAAQNLNSQALTNVNIDSGNIASAVVLADGITATTQTSTDDSTKLATTAFVHDVVKVTAVYDGGTGVTYTAANQAITASNHSLGGAPDIVNCIAECLSADLGYSAGDRVHIGYVYDVSGTTIGASCWGNATQVGGRVGGALWIPNKSTGNQGTASTSSKWKLLVTAIRFV